MSSLSRLAMGLLAFAALGFMRMATPSPWFLLACTMYGMTGKTNLRHAVDEEIGENSVGKGSRGRGQSGEKHRLSLHCGWCSIAVGSKRVAVVSFGRISVIV